MSCHVMLCYVTGVHCYLASSTLLYSTPLYSLLYLLLFSTCVLKTFILCGRLYPMLCCAMLCCTILCCAMLHSICSISSGLHLSSLPLCTAFTSFLLSLASLSHVEFLLTSSYLISPHIMLCVFCVL
jgi:hypothetical protein